MKLLKSKQAITSKPQNLDVHVTECPLKPINEMKRKQIIKFKISLFIEYIILKEIFSHPLHVNIF